MIKVDGSDRFFIWWDPLTDKRYLKIECRVCGIKKTITIEYKPEWLVELYKFLKRVTVVH